MSQCQVKLPSDLWLRWTLLVLRGRVNRETVDILNLSHSITGVWKHPQQVKVTILSLSAVCEHDLYFTCVATRVAPHRLFIVNGQAEKW